MTVSKPSNLFTEACTHRSSAVFELTSRAVPIALALFVAGRFLRKSANSVLVMLRAEYETLAPWRRNVSTIWRPIPRVPPVQRPCHISPMPRTGSTVHGRSWKNWRGFWQLEDALGSLTCDDHMSTLKPSVQGHDAAWSTLLRFGSV